MVTPWKFNIAPENVPSQKGRIVVQPSFFRGKLAVKLQGCIFPLSCSIFQGCNPNHPLSCFHCHVPPTIHFSGFFFFRGESLESLGFGSPPFRSPCQVVAADEAVASEAAAEADGIKKAKTGMGMEGRNQPGIQHPRWLFGISESSTVFLA